MSGRRAPHLQRRDGIYHLRLRVPDAIRPWLGRSEVRRTLRTSDYAKARSLAARYAAKVMEVFEVITTSRLPREQARKIVQACFADLIAETEATPLSFGEIGRLDLAPAEQHGLSAERVRDLRQQLIANVFDGTVIARTRDAAVSHGEDWDRVADQNKLDLTSGIARALVEQQRLFQLRLTDRLADFVPEDALFRYPSPIRATLASSSPASVIGTTVAAAVQTYLDAGEKQWVRKTHQARMWQLGFFCQHVDPETPLSAVSVAQVRSFRDALCRLHHRHGRMKGTSFAQRQTPSTEHQISAKTASIIFDALKAFLRWAKSVEGLIDTNPADDIRIALPKRAKGQKSRRPFTASELMTLFTSSIYVGCKSVNRRYEPGPHVIKDATFWVPVLGFYLGARLGELIQLHVADVDLTGAIPFVSFNEINPAGGKTADKKHLKTEAAVRLVPLHPDVLELGFADFVARRARKAGKGRVRLFDEFPYGSDDQASTVASKWFARFMDKVGLTDRSLVFHSLRHTAEDAFRDALQPQYVTDKIIGHSDGATSSVYGEGASLDVMYDAVKAMRLKVQVPNLLKISKKPE